MGFAELQGVCFQPLKASFSYVTMNRFLVVFSLFCGTGPIIADVPNYRRHVRPIFREKCVGCHNPNRREGELDLSSYDGILRGSSSGEVVEPGAPDDSLLYLVITHQEEPAMPPDGRPINERHQQVMRAWIGAGAPETAAATSPVETRQTEPERSISPGPSESVSRKSHDRGIVFKTARDGAITALAHHPTDGTIARSNQKQVILQSSSGVVEVLPFPEGENFDLKFSSDGKKLIAAGGSHAESGKVVAWDLERLERVAEYGDAFDVVLATDLSPDGSTVVFGGPERVLTAMNASTGQVRYSSDKHTDWILDVAIDDDGFLFVSADRAGNVFVWELNSGELVHTLRGHRGGVHQIAWLSSGDSCATAGEDGTVRLWDMHSGRQLTSWTADPNGVLGLATTPEDDLVTIGRSGSVSLWDKKGTQKKTVETSLPVEVCCGDEEIFVGNLNGQVIRYSKALENLGDLPIPKERTTAELAEIDMQPRLASGFLNGNGGGRALERRKELAMASSPPSSPIRPAQAETETDPFQTFELQLEQERDAYNRLLELVVEAESELEPRRDVDGPVDGEAFHSVLDHLRTQQAKLAALGDADERIHEVQVLLKLAVEKGKEVVERPVHDRGQLEQQLARWKSLTERIKSHQDLTVLPKPTSRRPSPWNALLDRARRGTKQATSRLAR